MSDWLTRIARRSLGQEEAIRPRTRALYEPASIDAGAPVETAGEGESLPATSRAAIAAKSPEPPERRPRESHSTPVRTTRAPAERRPVAPPRTETEPPPVRSREASVDEPAPTLPVMPRAAEPAARSPHVESGRETPPPTVRPQGPAYARRDRAAADPPVINVTIGRIEVKAVQPQRHEPEKTEGMAPALSLDAYLRRAAERRG